MRLDYSFKIPSYTVHDIGDIYTLSQIYPQSIQDLKIPDVWKKTKGKGICIAVLDTGTPKNHPDLMHNIDLAKSRSFIDGEDIWDTFHGHSTHVGGTIAAIDNHFGIVGVAPETTLVTIKVLGKNGRGSSDSIKKGLDYCLKIKPDVVNMSLGSPTPLPDIHNSIKNLKNVGITIVAAAGNDGKEEIMYPANYEEVIAVGSYGSNILKNRSSFSNYGDTLDILAPGEEILSTYLNGQYAVLSGTSMATPVVSGVIALMLSYTKMRNIHLTPDNIKELLIKTAIDVGPRGFDKHTGYGVVNPEQIFNNIYNDPNLLEYKRKLPWWKRLFRRK
jgi:major intracellular serine protease